MNLALVLFTSLGMLGAPQATRDDGDDEQSAPRVSPRRASVPRVKIADVQEHALAYAQLNGERVALMLAASSWKAALPVLEVSGGYTQTQLDDSTLNEEFSSTKPWVVRGADGNAVEGRARLTWDLSRFVYNNEQVDVLQVNQLREHVLERATSLYYARLRALADADAAADADVRREKLLRAEEAGALLSGLTGGWFAKALRGE